MEEYTTSYDYRDYERSERSEWIPPKLATEPKNLADGLREYIETQACKAPLENKKSVDFSPWFDEKPEEDAKKYDYTEDYREIQEEKARTPMYDFGTGKMSNEKDMEDFYGGRVFSRIRKEVRESFEMPDRERKNGHISKELFRELKQIRAGKKPHPITAGQEKSARNQSSSIQINNNKTPIDKPSEQKSPEIKVIQRERQNGDDYFLRTERGTIRNETYRELFKGPGVVYEWLWANLVRSEWIDTKGYPIKEKYYDKGFLAYCSSFEKIGKDCGMSKNTAKKYIDQFQKAGIIKIEPLTPEGKKRAQSVFILGTWSLENGKRVERYFRDEVFLSVKNGQNLPN